MNFTASLPKLLRAAAVAVFLAGLGLWLAHGARLGWTQTSVVTMQRDEITGIDYPVRSDGFVAGVEVPAVGLAAAGALVALSFLPRRGTTRRNAIVA
jgi:hypothetical protein